MSERRDNPQPGLAARWPGICPVCDNGFGIGARIVYRRGEPIHCACAAGGDDQ